MLFSSEADVFSLAGLSCRFGSDCGCLLFYGAMISLYLGVSLRYSSIYRVNQVSLRSILSGAPLCEMVCTRSVQYGGIVTYVMNGAIEN